MKSLFLTIALVLSSVCFSQTKVRVTSVEIGRVVNDSMTKWSKTKPFNEDAEIIEGEMLKFGETNFHLCERQPSNAEDIYIYKSVNLSNYQDCVITYFVNCDGTMVIIIRYPKKEFYFQGIKEG